MQSVPTSPRAKRDHDLRNHLYIVASFAQLLQDGAFGTVTEAQREYLSYIVESAARAQRLLDPAAKQALPAAQREAA